MIEFGMPTLIGTDTLEKNIALAKELGLGFVELNMNLPEYQTACLESADFIAAARNAGIGFTIHLDENLNVADFNPEVRNAWLETVIRTIRAAGRIGASVLNMHMNHGVYFTLPDKRIWLYGTHRDRYLRCIEMFRDACARETGGTDIRICLENTDGFTDFEQEALALLLESPVFGLTWDIGHSRAAGERDEPFLRAHEDRLVHFHVHDAAGAGNHMTLGTGGIDLEERLQIAQRHGCRCVIETKTADALRDSVGWLNAHGYGSAREGI